MWDTTCYVLMHYRERQCSFLTPEEKLLEFRNLGKKKIIVLVSGDLLYLKMPAGGASLVAQWLRIRLPMQGTWVQALVWVDPTCRGATKPVRHNY